MLVFLWHWKSGPKDTELLMLYLHNISLYSNVKCNMTHELMFWSSVCHQIPCKSYLFFNSAWNSKCVTECCSCYFIFCCVLHFIPFFSESLITKCRIWVHLIFFIHYHSFMSAAYLSLLTCKHYFVHSFCTSNSYTVYNIMFYFTNDCHRKYIKYSVLQLS